MFEGHEDIQHEVGYQITMKMAEVESELQQFAAMYIKAMKPSQQFTDDLHERMFRARIATQTLMDLADRLGFDADTLHARALEFEALHRDF